MNTKLDKETQSFFVTGLCSILGALLTAAIIPSNTTISTLSGFLFGLGVSYLTLSYTSNRNKANTEKLNILDEKINNMSKDIKKILTHFNISIESEKPRKYFRNCLSYDVSD
ncbi:MAG: hypothetical protein WAO91_08790 [Candidatus Nitrosotenuis sp.]